MCNTCFFRLIFWFSSSDSTFFPFYSLVSGLPCVKCATGSDRHKAVATARFVQFRFASQRNTRKPFVARMRARLCFCPFYSFGFLGPLPHTLREVPTDQRKFRERLLYICVLFVFCFGGERPYPGGYRVGLLRGYRTPLGASSGRAASANEPGLGRGLNSVNIGG